MKNKRSALLSIGAASLVGGLVLIPALNAQAQVPAKASAMASTAPPETATALDFINIFEKLSGSQPGLRKAHAKGVCATAVFEPNREAAYFKDAALFGQDSLPATVRFSVGSGNPASDERIPGARGMAIQIKLPNGSAHTITGNSTPVFSGKDPQTFLGFLRTLVPDETGQVNFAGVGAYVAANPSVQAAAMWSRTTPAPASYANTPYFGLHTFFFEDSQIKEKIKYRWQLTPILGDVGLTKEQAASMPAVFLADKIKEQMDNPDIKVSFTLTATIGIDADTNVDPSQVWPADREQVAMGSITITEVGGMACDKLNFDPNILSAGFTPSADPVLRMRSPAYGISFGKRLSNQ
ncbi:MAG: catalase [Glaciecola sp.]|jgi:catalase